MVVQEAGKSDRRELREMRGQADGVVVLLRAEPERRAPIFRESHEGEDRGSSLAEDVPMRA